MDKSLNYIALARKGGMIELGEEPVGAITRTGKGYLVAVASDASDHTWRRAKSFVAGTEQQAIRIPYTKEEFGFVVGRTSLAIAAFSDVAMALAFVKALPQPEKYSEELASLEERTRRVQQRQKEAKAHVKNRQMGKKPSKKH